MHNMHISMMWLKQCHKPSPHLTMYISGMVTISMGGKNGIVLPTVDLSNIDSLLTNSPFLLKQGPPLKAFLSIHQLVDDEIMCIPVCP